MRKPSKAKGDGELKRINRRLDDVLWYFGRLLTTQDAVSRQLIQEMRKMAGELERLTTEVEESTTVIQGAIVLFGQLSQLIRDLKNDPAKLAALADQLDSDSTALGEALVTNTPAAEEPPQPE